MQDLQDPLPPLGEGRARLQTTEFLNAWCHDAVSMLHRAMGERLREIEDSVGAQVREEARATRKEVAGHLCAVRDYATAVLEEQRAKTESLTRDVDEQGRLTVLLYRELKQHGDGSSVENEPPPQGPEELRARRQECEFSQELSRVVVTLAEESRKLDDWQAEFADPVSLSRVPSRDRLLERDTPPDPGCWEVTPPDVLQAEHSDLDISRSSAPSLAHFEVADFPSRVLRQESTTQVGSSRASLLDLDDLRTEFSQKVEVLRSEWLQEVQDIREERRQDRAERKGHTCTDSNLHLSKELTNDNAMVLQEQLKEPVELDDPAEGVVRDASLEEVERLTLMGTSRSSEYNVSALLHSASLEKLRAFHCTSLLEFERLSTKLSVEPELVTETLLETQQLQRSLCAEYRALRAKSTPEVNSKPRSILAGATDESCVEDVSTADVLAPLKTTSIEDHQETKQSDPSWRFGFHKTKGVWVQDFDPEADMDEGQLDPDATLEIDELCQGQALSTAIKAIRGHLTISPDLVDDLVLGPNVGGVATPHLSHLSLIILQILDMMEVAVGAHPELHDVFLRTLCGSTLPCSVDSKPQARVPLFVLLWSSLTMLVAHTAENELLR
mmetsp:Transcript_24836/g.65239  ORF Transcript_24836/g.65239 Transcript_24836/m.65239 type:complete len:613 (-) Transcript_24836:262-2100(-)